MTLPSRVPWPYRGLLHLLPRAFRDEYLVQVEASLTTEFVAARRQGRWTFWRTAGLVTWDIVRGAFHEHWRRRTYPAKPRETMMREFWTDLRFAHRAAKRQKGATLLVLITLGMAIAATIAVFALLDGLFLRPLPFSHAERLTFLSEEAPLWHMTSAMNYADFIRWQEQTTSFEAMGLLDPGSFNVALGGNTTRLQGANVTSGFAAALGIAPVVGRGFLPADDRRGGPHVVMLGYGFWQSQFGGAADVIGRTLRIDGAPYTVIGVLPVEADFPGNVQLWLPFGADLNANPDPRNRNYQLFEAVGRLKPGVTLERARADLLAAQQSIWRERDPIHIVGPSIMPLRERYVAGYRSMGRVLGLAVLLVLLVACANVGGAMLARATFRQRELAIRLALGASTRRITRQMLTEAVALAVAAGMAGTALGWWGLRLLMVASADRLPAWVRLHFDGRLMLVALGIVGGTAVLFGLAPAFEARSQDIREMLAASGTRVSASRRQRRALNGLVVVEISLAAVLLVSGGLLWQQYADLRQVDPGFRPEGVAAFRLSLPMSTYRTGLEQHALYQRVVDRLSALPGVTAAGAVTCLPFSCIWTQQFIAEGQPTRPTDGSSPSALTRIATPGYFEAMSIRLVRGRVFQAGEGGQGGFRPAVVDEEFARLKWPGLTDPTGQRFKSLGDSLTDRWMTVIGVVKDVRHYGVARATPPGVYLPIAFIDTAPLTDFAFVAHTTGDPSRLMAPMRAALHDIDPELPPFEMRTMQSALDSSLAAQRTLTTVLAAFATIALVLALSGVYAVLSYVVGRQRQEIGVRMALGARRSQVLTMVVWRGVRLVVTGLAFGIPAALVATRVLGTLAAGVATGNLRIYGAVVLLLIFTGIAAAFAPARRAASVSPTAALSEGREWN